MTWRTEQGGKRCSKCLVEKGTAHFYFTDRRKLKRSNQCRSCKSLRMQKKYTLVRIHREQLKVDMGGTCNRCGESDLQVLEFDHLNPKSKVDTVSSMRRLDLLDAEASKCQLLCCFCHCLRTYEQKHRDVHTKAPSDVVYLREYIKKKKIDSGKCNQCSRRVDNEEHPGIYSAFHWDHIEPLTKRMNVSDMPKYHRSLQEIDEEIGKCQLLCANCHRRRTLVQMRTKNNWQQNKYLHEIRKKARAEEKRLKCRGVIQHVGGMALRRYDTIRKAAKAVKVSNQGVCTALIHGNPAGGFLWVYADQPAALQLANCYHFDDETVATMTGSRKEKSIIQHANGVALRRYQSITKASAAVDNISISNIGTALHTGRRAGGYNWSFVDDPLINKLTDGYDIDEQTLLQMKQQRNRRIGIVRSW